MEGSNPLLSGLLDQEPEEEMFDSEPNMVVVEEAKHFLDASLYESAMASLSGPLRNKEIVDYLLRQEIIIERSPPETVSLMSLLSHGTHVGIGSLLGYTIAGGDIPLMCLTVPAGVMVMGAAAGVSNGLKSGLQKTIEKLFKVTKSAAPERRRRRIRKDVVQGKITAKKEPPANKA